MARYSPVAGRCRPAAGCSGKLLLPLLLFLLFPAAARPQAVTIPAELITADSGMSSEYVYSIFQDRLGFMWFGTSLGVARHDGLHYKVFRRANTLPSPLSNDYILAITQDAAGNIWLGTANGLNRLDAATETFTVFRHDPLDPSSLSGNVIYHLGACSSRPGSLWVSTTDNGLGLFDPETGKCKSFRADPSRPGALGSNEVRKVFEDSRRRVWVATAGGLYRFRPENGSFEAFRHDPGNPRSLGDDSVLEIFESPRRPGILWVGGEGNVLNRFDPERSAWERFELPGERLPAPLRNPVYCIADCPEDPDMLLVGTRRGLFWFNVIQGSWQRIALQDQYRETGDSGDEGILGIYHDGSGVCWVGVQGRGLIKFLPQPELFRSRSNADSGLDPMRRNRVFRMGESADGRLWLATGAGLFRCTPDAADCERVVLAPALRARESFDIVSALGLTRRGELWAATYGGLVRLDPLTGEQQVFAAKTGDAATLGFTQVASICDDAQGDVWIGSDFCLLRWNGRTRSFRRYRHDPGDPGSLSSSHVNPILEDRAGDLWIGTENGLNVYDRVRDRFTRYYLDPPDPSKETQNYVLFLHQDVKGRIWVGTSNGLNLMERTGAGVRFLHFSAPGSTLRNFILGMVEDDEENLWISSAGGLSRFDTRTRTFSEYGARDRVPAMPFFYGSCLRLRSGEIFFGGTRGMVSFKPWLARINRYVPPLAFTDIQIGRRPLAIGGDSPLQRSIALAPDLDLSHRQNSLILSFAALSFVHPEMNQYAYRLDGRDGSTYDLGFEHSVNLDNLKPGRYRLRVWGSNNEGVWNRTGLSLAIRIRPPFWQTWWFRLLVLLTAAAVVVQLNRTRARRLAARIRTETAMENYFDKFGISAREREIIHLLLRGMSNHEIEDALFISVSTVKIHVYHIFQKLKIKNRAQLISLFKNLQVK